MGVKRKLSSEFAEQCAKPITSAPVCLPRELSGTFTDLVQRVTRASVKGKVKTKAVIQAQQPTSKVLRIQRPSEAAKNPIREERTPPASAALCFAQQETAVCIISTLFYVTILKLCPYT